MNCRCFICVSPTASPQRPRIQNLCRLLVLMALEHENIAAIARNDHGPNAASAAAVATTCEGSSIIALAQASGLWCQTVALYDELRSGRRVGVVVIAEKGSAPSSTRGGDA